MVGRELWCNIPGRGPEAPSSPEPLRGEAIEGYKAVKTKLGTIPNTAPPESAEWGKGGNSVSVRARGAFYCEH